MDEVFARERLERAIGIDPESRSGLAHLPAAGTAVGCELAQDPEVELALRVGEAGAAGWAELGGRDRRHRERCGHARRQLAWAGAFGVDAHFAASVSASRTQLSCGCSVTPRSLR
jgi:hypothetical protein